MASAMRWVACTVPEADIHDLAKQIGCRPLLARLLLRCSPDLQEAERAARFLDPQLAHFEDPFRIRGMGAAVNRLVGAIDGGERVLIFGDYDVDGITSTVALTGFLRNLGLAPDFLVPRRLEEGYGLTRAAAERALAEHGVPQLFIALDCGTNSAEVVELLKGKGCDLLVIDHHQGQEGSVADCLLVNPHLEETDPKTIPPWRDLCTAGLVFKLIHALVKRLREERRAGADAVRVADYLDLCALGTVADLVPLTGENRLIAHAGLRQLSRATRPGLQALLREAGLEAGSVLEASDVSFRLGPRINAVGRLDDARLPVELLLATDHRKCQAHARTLSRLNQERKAIEGSIFEEACDQIRNLRLEESPVIVVSDEGWHHGVVGIVASRLVQRYNRPCLVLGGVDTMQTGGSVALRKGSGRSVAGVDLVSMLERCAPLLEQWGGHPMAVGLTARASAIGALRDCLAEAMGVLYPGGLPKRVLELAAWLDPTEVTSRLLADLDRLRPFGPGNPRPLFGLRGVLLAGAPRLMKNEHFRFAVSRNGDAALGGVAWRMADRLPPMAKPLDLAVRVEWNEWRGQRRIQLELFDWRLAAD